MRMRRLHAVVAGLGVAIVLTWPAGAQTPPVQDVPSDLVPLLVKPESEMRIVVQRYRTDRTTLSGNFVGGGGGGRGGGRGGRAGGAGAAVPEAAPAATTAPVSLSTARIARLKRFDLEWQTALARIDGSKLSAAARPDLDGLKSTVITNLTQLETETAAIAQVTPVVPFGPALVQLLEARLRLKDVNSQKAAGVLTQVTKEIGQMQARFEGGLRLDRDQAVRAAATVESLRSAVTGWFNFYNGYDPLFTWWMGLPYKNIDGALQRYSALLSEKVAAAGQTSSLGAPAPLSIPAAPAPKFSSVPDLNEILALPQDEMTAVVQRFNSGGGGGRGNRGGGTPRGREFYTGWLAALKTLDFDKLSRNAQVDYLYIRKASESAIARLDFKPQPNIPRKTDTSGIPGPARGRDGLILDLLDEMIPYTPEQLIALANKEFAWQEAEMKKASRALGFGDDWKKAIEKVKDSHAAPGEQPGVIRDLLSEAIAYLRARDLITVPQVAAESLRMSMMSPERQLVNPFFTGGAQITVSYPTNTMEYEARLQSMRGNTTDFSHATAHHEMIPGHNLVGYMGARFGEYRPRIGGGGTPFFGEGWPVYWETILYDMGFHDSPGERIGALFWLMHRSARIIFSLTFHMGIWSPQECIDFLVEKVGHERDNATAEVRRSFDPAAGYGPLYQAAYLLGALQLRGLRQELVDSKQMTQKQFHDEIMRQGSMPINYLRLALTKQKLTRDMVIDWKFYGELPSK